jgi:hypothetical protein
MHSIRVAPSATISPDLGTRWYSGAGQSKRHDLRLVPSVEPNAAVESIVALGSNVAARDIDQLVILLTEPLGNLTMDVAEEAESFDRFFDLTEGMADAPHRQVFVWSWTGLLAPLPRIETLADRSRAAIDELTRLEFGWDGYDGGPVLPRVAEHALRLLEAIGAHTQMVPDVVPLSNGGLQLEWYVGVHEIEVEIAPDFATNLHRERAGDESPIEVPIGDPRDISQVAAFFRELRR